VRTVNNDRLPTEQLHSQDEETRRQAVVGLGAYPLSQTAGHLFRAMGDASWRVRKEAVEIMSAGSPDAALVEQLVDLLRSPDNAGLRNCAAEVLVRLGSRSIPALQHYVADSDHDVRKFILDIMGSIGDASVVPLLIAALADPDANVRAAAVENLGKTGDPRAVQPLVDALGNPDIWLRYTILEALARIGIPVPLEVLAPLSAATFLKKAVYACLAVFGGADAVPILLNGLFDKGQNAREAAACALAQVRDRVPPELVEQLVDNGLKKLKTSRVVEELLGSLGSSDIRVRKAIVLLLGIIGDVRSFAGILHCCRDERLRDSGIQALKAMSGPVGTLLLEAFPAADGEERCTIACLCGEMALEECTPLLIEGMADPVDAVRRAFVLACGKQVRPELLPRIVEILHDADPDVRQAAVETLARYVAADPQMIAEVAGLQAADADPQQRRHAALLFGALQDAESLALLMKDEAVAVRKAAVVALAGLRRADCARSLIMALVDEDPDVRIAAASTLVETAGMAALEPLLLLLNDDDPRVQCAALKSLGKLKQEQSVIDAVEAVVARATGVLMIAALEVLGSIGGEKANALLEKALVNDDEEVVKTAMEFLARGGDWWVEKHLDALLHHPHWGVRSCFIRILAGLWRGKAVPYLKLALVTEHDNLVREQIRQEMGRCQ
jgi:HEAT repeat protein